MSTFVRDHYDYDQALLVVGFFNLEKLLVNFVFEIERKKTRMDKNSKKVSIFRLTSA